MVSQYSSLGYDLPIDLEVATGILLHYHKHKERLFSDGDPPTYTRCMGDKQLVGGSSPIIAVGGFGDTGLDVATSGLEPYTDGVAACRRLLGRN